MKSSLIFIGEFVTYDGFSYSHDEVATVRSQFCQQEVNLCLCATAKMIVGTSHEDIDSGLSDSLLMLSAERKFCVQLDDLMIRGV